MICVAQYSAMKSKSLEMKTLLLSFGLIFCFSATGQRVHELKADVLLPFFKGAHLSYEYIPNKRLGIEFEGRYIGGIDGYYAIQPPAPSHPEAIPEYVEAGQQVLILTLAAKYYVIKSRVGSGLFAGCYLRSDLLVTKEIDLYEELYILGYADTTPNHGRFLRNGFGLLSGWKEVIGKHFFFEIGIGLDFNFNTAFRSQYRKFDMAGIPTLKAGYRF